MTELSEDQEAGEGSAQYAELREHLEALRGRGMAVSSGAKKRCVADRHELLAERLAVVVLEAVGSGLDPARLREMFDRALDAATSYQGRN